MLKSVSRAASASFNGHPPARLGLDLTFVKSSNNTHALPGFGRTETAACRVNLSFHVLNSVCVSVEESKFQHSSVGKNGEKLFSS